MYILDSDFFIQSKNRHYQFEVFPSFWQWLDGKAKDDDVLLLSSVVEEINKKDDVLKIWLSKRKDKLWYFDVSSNEIQLRYIDVVNFAEKHNVWSPEEKMRFFKGADPWIVAVAMQTGAVVVTHETFIKELNTRKVKLPNVCANFGVKYMNPFEFLRSAGCKI